MPVAVFFTKDWRCLYFLRDWGALQQSPFLLMWASAAIDEILAALHERIVVGPLA